MASSAPFNPLHSSHVIPVVCIECGNNAHCIRREPGDGKELQTFKCAVCGAETLRLRGLEESDAEIEQIAEQRSGMWQELLEDLGHRKKTKSSDVSDRKSASSD